MLRESLGLAQDDDIDRQGEGWLKNVWDDTLLPSAFTMIFGVKNAQSLARVVT